MLIDLKVSNFAIIESLHVTFRDGLNILSGETGAGKSVLLKSLSLLMGGKASADTIRSGATQATIEGSFDISKRSDIKEKLNEMGIDAEDTLVIRRLLTGDKSKVYLNGSLGTLNGLRDIVAPMIEVAGASKPLIEMTGQHDNRNLTSKQYHLDLLDQYSAAWDQRMVFTASYGRLNTILREIKEIEATAKEKAQRLDFLTFQRDEIANLDLVPGEEESLESEIKLLKNSSKITSFMDAADGALCSDDDSAVNRIKAVIKKGAELAAVDSKIAAKLEELEGAKSTIEDCVYELQRHSGSIDSDPRRLDDAEGRLSAIRKLQKKHGSTIDEILETLKKLEEEISGIENTDHTMEILKKEAQALQKNLQKMGEELHSLRASGANKLSAKVNSELLDLNMKGVTFHVSVQKSETMSSTGLSDVEFMSQTSLKDDKRPLAKFASGGELSRILLSLKRVAGSGKQPRTYIFDEVDAGVSGETAERVGRKLKQTAQGQQVICVTHLPQVAAFGDCHFFIQKSSVEQGHAAMAISELKSHSDRAFEIARLISGEKISKSSLAHAEQLLKDSK